MVDPAAAPQLAVQGQAAMVRVGGFGIPRPLPVPLTSFVGRAREVAAVVELLADAAIRLVTLVGPGGIGKTRLAVQIGTVVEPDFRDGVVFIPLADIADPVFVLPAIARHLGVRDSGDQPLIERVAEALQDRHLLVILDNFEQVLGAAASIAELLATCRYLTLVVTSRAALRISGEHEFVVPPLGVEEAVRLFVDRARAVRQTFAVTADNERAIVELCGQFDQLPLAVELAAARAKVLSPEAMLARLDPRLPFLIAGPVDAPKRLQTMHGAIGWSYDLLNSGEQNLFRQVAVFLGGFSLEAAEAVCHDANAEGFDLLARVASLVDKSLLQVTEQAGASRFSMLETIREFGLERLEESGDALDVRSRHTAYIRSFAERAQPALYGPDQRQWFDQIQIEHPNIRVALAWAEQQGDVETCLAVVASIWPFWFTRGHLSEGRHWLERALSLPLTPGPRDWVEVVHGVGSLAHQLGDYQRTLTVANELVTTSERLKNAWGVARGKYMMSRAVGALGDHPRSAELAEESARGFRALGDDLWLAYALNRLGVEAAACGEHEQAVGHFQEALGLWRRLGNLAGIAMALDALAEAARHVGNDALAASSAQESLLHYVELGDPVGTIEALVTVTAHAAPVAQPELIARLLGAVDGAREALGYVLYAHHLAAVERLVPTLRTRLGERALTAALSAGRALPLESAVAEALELASSNASTRRSRESHRTAGGRTLSSRERDVLSLLAAGSSDREIADALFISPRTAQGHVARILNKLDVPNRAAAAVVAAREGLLADDASSPAEG